MEEKMENYVEIGSRDKFALDPFFGRQDTTGPPPSADSGKLSSMSLEACSLC